MGLSAGTRLGPYEIVAPLGSGGMGEVYRAKDTRLDRAVALKVLPEEFFENKESIARFEREAKSLAAVSHPNIAVVHSLEEISGRYLLVQELLEGETLREALTRGSLPLKKALDVGLQVAEGLAAAHGKGIVHRDVKPENIFLTRDSHAKLLDFGLARHDVTRHDPADTRSPTLAAVSEKGVVLGTAAYMSPEQARGETVDFRSDQFSLGTVLYETLTGTRPFQRDTVPETMTAIIREEPEPVTKLDPKFPALIGWIVQRCLSKDPEDRYSSTKDLAKELQNLRTHLSEAINAADVAPGETPRLRRRVPYWALTAVGALAVALGLLLVIRFGRIGSPLAPSRSLSLSFPLDAALDTRLNPLTLSPDGKTLVYVGLTGDRSQIFIRPLDREEIRAIPGTDGASFPFFSPDGLWLGFFAEQKLKKVAVAGGLPMTLCDAPRTRGGSWGPDDTIVFVPSPSGGIWRIPTSGGEPKLVLAANAEKGERPVYPQILPDGENVLFQAIYGGWMGRATVISFRTGEQRIVMEDARYPRYLPTGHLAFTRSGLLYAAPFSVQRLETNGPPVLLLEDLATTRMGPAVAKFAYSQEGTLVYVPYRPPQRTLVWVDRKGAVEPAPFPTGGYVDVALSPDGGRLAATSMGKAEELSLLFGAIGRRTLTRSRAEGTFDTLAWSPDGERVAFGFSTGRELYRAFWQSADGSDSPERLTGETTPQQEHPTSFSPDGRALLLSVYNFTFSSSAETRWQTLVLPLFGDRKPRPLLQTKFSVTSAVFSPDGRWVAYVSDESGRFEVYVQPYPVPGPRWQISTEGGAQPRWSRSGRELFYLQGKKMISVGVEMKPTFRAGRSQTLFEGTYFTQFTSSYDVTPDGTRFLMIKEDPADLGPAHVKVVLNWFEDVKRRVPGAK